MATNVAQQAILDAKIEPSLSSTMTATRSSQASLSDKKFKEVRLRQLKCNDKSAFMGGSHKHFFPLLRLFWRSKKYLLVPHSRFSEDDVYNFLFSKHNDQHLVLNMFTKDARKVLTENADGPRIVAIVLSDIYETLMLAWETNHDLDKSYVQRIGDSTHVPIQQLTSWYTILATADLSLVMWATALYHEAIDVHLEKMRARCRNEYLLKRRHHEDNEDGDEADRDTKKARKRPFAIAGDMTDHAQRGIKEKLNTEEEVT